MSETAVYTPTFFDAQELENKWWKIIAGVLWFILLESGVIFITMSAPRPIWFQGILFVAFSIFSVMFAIVAGFITVNYVDVLFHALIGQGRYVFLDQKGQLHVHRQHPIDAYGHKAFSTYDSWETFLFYHRIFQIRSGGIFRKCRVIANGGTAWKLSVGLFDDRIIVSDDDGSRIAVGTENVRDFHFATMFNDRLKQTLRYTAKYRRICSALTALDEHKEFDLAFDRLGVECTELVHLMEASKQTMGRSKHAQLLRERLEAVFKKMPKHRMKSWEDKVAKAEAKPEPSAKTG